MISDDFDLIKKKFSEDTMEIRIYPLGDTQVGSKNFDEKLFFAWRDMVEADPYGYSVLVGDMVNNGTKTSKSNTYAESMRPREQKAWLKTELYPIRHKILGAVRGNHEERSVNETDDCPLYDIMCKLDIEDLYRENLCFLNLSLGKKANGKQANYNIVLAHGASRNKTENFSYTIDGMDVFVTGHIHRPASTFPAKLVIDPQNSCIRRVGFTNVVVPSFDRFGGYTASGLYMPQDSTKVPVVMLSGHEKEVNVLWKTVKYM